MEGGAKVSKHPVVDMIMKELDKWFPPLIQVAAALEAEVVVVSDVCVALSSFYTQIMDQALEEQFLDSN